LTELPDFEAEGLLDGVEGEAREARRDLLAYLYEQGVSLEELHRAVEDGRLVLLPVERVLAEEQKYTATEVARMAGVDREVFLAQRRAAGLPTPAPRERAFTDSDVAAARRLRTALELGVPREPLLEGARAFGRAVSEAAAATRRFAGEAFLRPGDTERDVGLRIAEAARTLHPLTIDLLQYLYNAHLREQLRNDVIATAELAAGRIEGTREVTVCFADLVGFTTLGEQVAPEDLSEIADRFGTLAAEMAEPPVSLIKMIGDAAMLVSPEPEPLLEMALQLVESARPQKDGLPELRAGLAAGEALNRFGDWYGSPVNMASRVTTIARPSSVLATVEVYSAAKQRFAWSHAGEWRLKGVPHEVSLYRCRRERLARFRRRRNR
jgi:adenylate cyclase